MCNVPAQRSSWTFIDARTWWKLRIVEYGSNGVHDFNWIKTLTHFFWELSFRMGIMLVHGIPIMPIPIKARCAANTRVRIIEMIIIIFVYKRTWGFLVHFPTNTVVYFLACLHQVLSEGSFFGTPLEFVWFLGILHGRGKWIFLTIPFMWDLMKKCIINNSHTLPT